MPVLDSLYLLFLCFLVAANLDQELEESIDQAMKCRYSEPPKGPVMAVTPSKFVQIVVILHQRFNTPSCGRSPSTAIKVDDKRTWPFCVFGRCIQNQCNCGGHFSGAKCGSYTKKCWLMYCYLTSCHPDHQSLHCICNPNLYGTKVETGIYWYNEGKNSKYIPPPAGWKDEPTDMIKLKSDTALQMGSRGRKPGGGPPGRGSKQQGVSGGTRNQNQLHGLRNGEKGTLTNQRPVGKTSGSEIFEGNDRTEGDAEEATKDDIEEALDELEEVSEASTLFALGANLAVVLIVSMQWIYRHAT